MNDNLKIRIIGTLNIGSTISEVNTAIRGIEQKINKLKLSIHIDEKVSKTLSDFSKAMEHQKNITQDLNRVIKEEKTVTKEADGTIREKIRQHLKSGEIIEKETTKIKQQTQATQKQKEETGKLISEIEKLGNVRKKVTKETGGNNPAGGSITVGDKFNSTTSTFNANNEVTSHKTVENYEQQKMAVEKLRQSLKTLYDQGKVNEQFFKNFNKVVDGTRNAKEIEKVQNALKRVQSVSDNRSLQQKLLNDSETLLRTHSKTVDTRGMNELINSLNRIKPSANNASNQLKQLENRLKAFRNESREAARTSMSLGTALTTAFQKFPIWVFTAGAIYTPLRLMRDAIQQIIDLDSQLTVLDRVSNGQININNALEDSIRLSGELGVKISELNEAMVAFARQGFRGEDLNDMAEVASLMSNVSELGLEESASALTAAIKGFGLQASDAINVVDRLNEVDNNFSITTKILSESLMKSAGAASVYGVSMENAIGYTTAIGQVTRESGNSFLPSMLVMA